MSSITENTRLNLTVVFVLLGGAAWLTAMELQGRANASSLEALDKKIAAIEEIKLDVAVIKTDVKNIDAMLAQMNRRRRND